MSRKLDHIRIALSKSGQSRKKSGLDEVTLDHFPLTELALESIKLECTLFGKNFSAPVMISCMTGGGGGISKSTNLKLAQLASKYNVPFGLGSMRSVLEKNKREYSTFTAVREQFPHLFIVANLGAQQLVGKGLDEILSVLELVKADALAIHLNPLQEMIQKEGDRDFNGIVGAIKSLKKFPVPIILKETGCGFGRRSLELISRELSFVAVDIAGLGGTHFGLVEQSRSKKGSELHQLGETFSDWGVPTVESLKLAREILPHQTLIASGGLRSGLDIVKTLCLGAQFTAIAGPFLRAVQGSNGEKFMKQLLYEIRVAMLLISARKIPELNQKMLF